MRKIFKSSFFSFFDNKLTITLLIIIIFLTTTTFTVLQSTVNSFTRSYNQTVLKGNLHDFTVNEKYTIKGNLNFLYTQESDDPQTKTVVLNAQFDKSKSTGDYLNYINKNNPANLRINIPTNEYTIAKKFIADQKTNPAPQALTDAVQTQKNTIDNIINKNFSNQFQSDVLKQYKNKVTARKVNSLTVTTRTGYLYKMVDTLSGNNKIDKTIIYEGQNVQNFQSLAQMKAKMDVFWKLVQKNPKKYGVDATVKEMKTMKYMDNFTKGYKYTRTPYKDNGIFVPLKTVFVQDETSVDAVVSWAYAKNHDLNPLGSAGMDNFKKSFNNYVLKNKKNEMFTYADYLRTDDAKQKFSSNILLVDSTPYLIRGIGTTPDFSFPIIDAKNPVPNSSNQAIVFLNQNGYKRIQDAFRSNETENYLAYKFNKAVPWNKQKQILDGINQIARNEMSWPGGVNIVSRYNDTTGERINMAPQRIAFLQRLNQTISTVTYVSTISLILLTGLITIIVVKRQIRSKRKTMATLVANGYSKVFIATSFMSLGVIVAAVPAILGYILGVSLQYAFINIFTNYWTLPITEVSFSYISLLVTAVLPIIAIGVLAFVIALWEQKGSLTNALYGVDSKSSSWLTSRLANSFSWLNTRNKLSLSLFSTNLSRALMILIASAASITAASVSITTLGKFSKALNATNATTNYKFKIDLKTPTIAGGQYELGIYKDPQKVDLSGGLENEITKSKQAYWVANNSPRVWQGFEGYRGVDSNAQSDKNLNQNKLFNKSYLHLVNAGEGSLAFGFLPSTANADNYFQSAEYLNHKVETKGLMNANMGFTGMSSNPWNVANALMPENQRNYADQKELDFFKPITDKNSSISKKYANAPWYKDVMKDGIPSPTNVVPKGLAVSLEPNIYHYYLDQMNAGFSPYSILYNQVASDISDEVYTSINGIIQKKNSGDKNIEITGINNESKYVNLSNSDYKKISQINSKEIPVIANKFFEANNKLSVGDTFKLSINNDVRRYERKQTQTPNPLKTFKIVGSINSYAGPVLYTSRENANQALGLNKVGFNGLFSKQNKPRVLDNINLYSPSGLYMPFDTIIQGQNSGQLLGNLITKYVSTPDANKYLSQNTINALLKLKSKDPKESITNFINKYSASTFLDLTSNVQWAQMNQHTFRGLMNLSSTLIWIVEVLVFVISIMFILTTASMMVESNKKTIASLKVMGYSDSAIRRILLNAFMPTMLLGAIISIPLVFMILKVMKTAIMSFGKVLVPFSMMGWEIPVVAIVIIMIFIVIFISSIRRINNDKMLNAFNVD